MYTVLRKIKKYEKKLKNIFSTLTINSNKVKKILYRLIT